MMVIGTALAVSAGLANDGSGAPGPADEAGNRAAPSVGRQFAQAQPPTGDATGTRRDQSGDEKSRGDFRSPRTGRFDTSDRPGSGFRRQLTPAEHDRALQILAELDPESAKRLTELRERDPAAFQRDFARFGRRLIGLMELEKRQPELFKVRLRELRLEVEERKLAEKIRQLREQNKVGEADALVPQLREKVKEHQGCRIQARGWELVLLDQHIKAMREQLQKDTENFDASIEPRVQMLLKGEPDRDPMRPPTDGPPDPAIQTIGADVPKDQ